MRRRRPLLGCWLLAVTAACAGVPEAPPAPAPSNPSPAELPAAPPVVRAQQPRSPAPGLGPEVLLPEADGADLEVARVGELVLRRSDAFTRLLSANPKLALSAVDLLVFDVLVAKHAQQQPLQQAGQ